jgi:hypothetical protein
MNYIDLTSSLMSHFMTWVKMSMSDDYRPILLSEVKN